MTTYFLDSDAVVKIESEVEPNVGQNEAEVPRTMAMLEEEDDDELEIPVDLLAAEQHKEYRSLGEAGNQDPLSDPLVDQAAVRTSSLVNKDQFLCEMESSIRSVVNECLCVLNRDPREYHPFYLRVYKYIFLGQKHGHIGKGPRSVPQKWERYDKFATAQYNCYLRNPTRFKMEGEYSPYLTYVLEGKVILNGQQVSDIRDEVELAKKFAELESIVCQLKRESPRSVDFRTDLEQRLKFFEHCKDVSYPSDTIKMNELWTKLLSDNRTEVFTFRNEYANALNSVKAVSGRSSGRRKATLVVKTDLDLEDLAQEFMQSDDEGSGLSDKDEDYVPEPESVISSAKSKGKSTNTDEVSSQKSEEINVEDKTERRRRQWRERKRRHLERTQGLEKTEEEVERLRRYQREMKRKSLQKMSEEERERFRERQREHTRKWMAELPPEKLEQVRERKRERDRKRRERQKLSSDFQERQREKRRKQMAKLTDEEMERRREINYFRQLERRITEKTLSEEEQQKLKNERYMKLQAYLASIPKEELMARRKRMDERRRIARKNEPSEWKKARAAKQLARVRSLTGEKLQKHKEMMYKSVKKYHARWKEQDPEGYKARIRSYIAKRYNRERDTILENFRERLKNETEEQRERRLLGYRVNQAKRKARKQMEEEGTWTPEEIEQRLEQVAEEVRNRPRTEKKSTYKPRPGARKPHKLSNATTSAPPLPPDLGNTVEEHDAQEKVPDECTVIIPRRKRGRPRSSAIKPPEIPPPPVQLQQEADHHQQNRSLGVGDRFRHRASPPPVITVPKDTEPEAEYLSPLPEQPLPPVVTNVTIEFDYPPMDISMVSSGEPEVSPETETLQNLTETLYGNDFEDDGDSMPSPSSLQGVTSTADIGIEDDSKIPCSHTESLLPPVNTVFADPKTATPEKSEIPDPLVSRSPSTKSSYICDECGNVFLSEYSVRQHKNLRHNPVGSKLDCPECGVTLLSPESLWFHYSRFHAKIDLPPEVKPTQNVQPTQVSRRRPAGTVKDGKYPRGTDQPNVCPECQKSFHQRSTLQDHIRRVHQGCGHICDICGRDQQSAVKLWRHQIDRHGMKDLPIPEGVRTVICEYCSEVVMRGYTQHILKVHPEHADKFTPERVVDQKTGAVRWKCPQCPTLLANKDVLQKHVRFKHTGEKRIRYPDYAEDSQEETDPCMCPDCGKELSSKSKMERHFRETHAFRDLEFKLEAKKLIEITSGRKVPSSAVCNLCKVDLPSRISIRAHFISDHLELMKEANDMVISLPTFHCPHCQKKFATDVQLKKHIQRIHSVAALKCQFCGEVKKSRAQLLNHEKSCFSKTDDGEATTAESFKCPTQKAANLQSIPKRRRRNKADNAQDYKESSEAVAIATSSGSNGSTRKSSRLSGRKRKQLFYGDDDDDTAEDHHEPVRCEDMEREKRLVIRLVRLTEAEIGQFSLSASGQVKDEPAATFDWDD